MRLYIAICICFAISFSLMGCGNPTGGGGGWGSSSLPANPPDHISTVDATAGLAIDSSLALDSKGRPNIAYNRGSDLMYAAWTGTKWVISTVDAGGLVGDISLALGSNNIPQISYYGGDNDLKYAKRNSSSWSVQTITSEGLVGRYNSIAIDKNNNPHIAYYDSTLTNAGDLIYVRLNGATWEFSLITAEGDEGRGVSLALDKNNKPHVVYLDGTPIFRTMYASLEGSTWVFTEVDTDTHQDCSIKIDSIGTPHISYMKDTDFALGYGFLKYAYKSGSTFNTSTIDATSSIYVGRYNSIAVDGNNRPHISYCNKLNPKSFKLAEFNGTTWNISTIETGAGAGYYSSIAVDSSGAVRMSYFNDANGDLKYYWK